MDNLIPLIAVIILTAIATGILAGAVSYKAKGSVVVAIMCIIFGFIAGILAPMISLFAIIGYAWKIK